MNGLDSLEQDLAKKYERLPNMPKAWRKWIALNAWWIALIVSISSALFVLVSIPGIGQISDIYQNTKIYPFRDQHIPVNALIANAIITIIFAAITAVTLFLSVNPLRRQQRRGWRLLFLNEMFLTLSAAISFVVLIPGFHLLTLLLSLMAVAIELYVLFQIRSEYDSRASLAKKADIIFKSPKSVSKKPSSKK